VFVYTVPLLKFLASLFILRCSAKIGLGAEFYLSTRRCIRLKDYDLVRRTNVVLLMPMIEPSAPEFPYMALLMFFCFRSVVL
jgi:hypothetical protein